jgi:DNA-binding Xre family transcriptional regulator
MRGMIRVTIKEAAQARGVANSKQLADLVGCAPVIIWRIWTGKQQPKLPMLDRICEALDCSLDELITRTAGKGRAKAAVRANTATRKK